VQVKKPEAFYILNGVRRALVAREAERKTIWAIFHKAGTRSVLRRVSLDRLFSPKAKVEQDARFFRIQPPIEKPIEVEPLGQPNQLPTVPLARVKLT
jgi:hypothetical protein